MGGSVVAVTVPPASKTAIPRSLRSEPRYASRTLVIAATSRSAGAAAAKRVISGSDESRSVARRSPALNSSTEAAICSDRASSSAIADERTWSRALRKAISAITARGSADALSKSASIFQRSGQLRKLITGAAG